MHGDSVVEWDVDVQKRLAKIRDDAAAHRYQHGRVREHHGAGCSACD